MNLRLSTPVLFTLQKEKENNIYISGGELKSEGSIQGVEEIGPAIDYTIFLSNDGFSDIQDAVVRFQYPVRYGTDESDRKLLYPVASKISGQFLTDYDVRDVNQCQVISKESSAGFDPNGYLLNSASRSNRDLEDEGAPSGGIRGLKKSCKDRKSTAFENISCDDECHACETIECNIGFIPQRQRIEIDLKFRLWQDTIREDFEKISTIVIFTSATLLDTKGITQFRLNSEAGDATHKSIKLSDKIVIDNNSSEIASTNSKLIYLVVAIVIGFLAWLLFWFCCGRRMFKSKPKSQKVYTVDDLESKTTGDRRKLKREASQYQQDKDKSGEGTGENTALLIKQESSKSK